MEVGNVESRVHLGLSGHDRLGGHYKGGQRWSEYYFIKYGHVACQNIGN